MGSTNQKITSRSNLRLAVAKVHVWQASLEQPAGVVQILETLLSEDERRRAGKIRYAQHRQSFTVSRGILRVLLSRYTSRRPEEIQFKYSLTGKPFLAGNEENADICFNLSHAGLLALYAFSQDRQVGIDVECIRPMDDMDQIASRNFSPGEYRRFQSVPERDRLMAFYHCWTRKEAFIKATGEGLTFPLREFEVSFEPGYPAELLSVSGSRDLARRWSMHDLKTWDGYAAALVVDGNDYSISHKQWMYTKFFDKKLAG